MASSTVGQLAPFFGTAGAQRGPLARTNDAGNTFGARMFGINLNASGLSTIQGYAHDSGVAAIRHITVLTQPPRPCIVAEYKTTAAGTFSFPNLPAGNYMVIDSMTDNSRVALVYDWVVVP